MRIVDQTPSNDHCEKFVQRLINWKIVFTVENEIASLEKLDGTVDSEEMDILS